MLKKININTIVINLCTILTNTSDILQFGTLKAANAKNTCDTKFDNAWLKNIASLDLYVNVDFHVLLTENNNLTTYLEKYLILLWK